jgi:hypothetical protein
LKSKNYVYLITVGEAEAKMIQDLLWSERIASELHPSAIADVLAGQAVHSNLSYDIRVPEQLLGKAKEMLDVKD